MRTRKPEKTVKFRLSVSMLRIIRTCEKAGGEWVKYNDFPRGRRGRMLRANLLTLQNAGILDCRHIDMRPCFRLSKDAKSITEYFDMYIRDEKLEATVK